jgi:hypothetical protein
MSNDDNPMLIADHYKCTLSGAGFQTGNQTMRGPDTVLDAQVPLLSVVPISVRFSSEDSTWDWLFRTTGIVSQIVGKHRR